MASAGKRNFSVREGETVELLDLEDETGYTGLFLAALHGHDQVSAESLSLESILCGIDHS